MNPRIKELAIASQLVYDDNEKLLTGWMSHVDLSEELTKFAELIIKDCMGLVYDGEPNWRLIDQIKEHFGVKE